MSADNYYLVRPATRREKKAAGLSGEAWTVEMRFASCDYITGERNRAHYLSRELDDAMAWAREEYSEYGFEIEPDVSWWLWVIAPARVWVRDTKARAWYWREKRRQQREWQHVAKAVLEDEACGCTPSNLDDIGEFRYDYDDWHDASGCSNAQATRERREREAGSNE